MTAYKLEAQYFGTARVIRTYTLNKYKRNVLQCGCGFVFERNNNKLMHKGAPVRQDICPKCRHSAARHTLASVYRSGYLWKRWDKMVKQAARFGAVYQGINGNSPKRIELTASVKDFFEKFVNIVDMSDKGYILCLKPKATQVSIENLIWSRHRHLVVDPQPVLLHKRKS